MADEAKSELAALRAEHKALVGKNPAPNLGVDALKAKITQLKGAPPAVAERPAPNSAPTAPAPVKGTAYMDHDDPDASASYMGAEIVRDVEGLFLVPLHAIEQLVAHGFKLIRGAE